MRSRNAVLVLLAGLLTLTSASPALAGSWSSPDQTGNAEGWHYDPDPAPCGTYTELDGALAAQADLTRLSVRHLRQVVRVRLSYADVRMSGEVQTSVQLRVPGQDWELSVIRLRGGRVMVDVNEAPDLSEIEPDECGTVAYIVGAEPCRGLAAHIRPATDRIDLRLPRRCIGEPRWVRASAYTGAEVDGDWYADAWGPAGMQADFFHRTFGPRVLAAR